ncbi:MAG TPA: GAF domain-containing protein [Mycobacteriales bacterium]|nr:GAF domain-containing protein [Mycobacteriales bacterium]
MHEFNRERATADPDPALAESAESAESTLRPGRTDAATWPARRAAVALRALEEVACAPGQASLLMEICVDRVREMVGGTGSAVALLQEGELFYSATAGDLRGRLSGSQPVSRSFGGLAVSTGQTLYAEDAQSDPRVARDIVASLGVRSVITTPLHQGRRRIGVLWVCSPEPAAFDRTDVELVARLGRVAGARLDYVGVRDERRSSEQALVDSQLQHAAVLASLDQGVLALDPARRVQLVNGAAERILGVPRERLLASDALGMPWGAICENGSPLRMDANPAESGRPADKPGGRTVLGVHRPDGALRWLAVTTTPVFDPSGDALRGVVACFSDVTEERERAGREDRDRRMLDATERLTGAGSWHWRPGSTAPHWSAGMYRLLGAGDRPPSVRGYLARVHPADRARVRRNLFAALRGGGCRTVEHRLSRPEGAVRTVRCSVEVRLDTDGRVTDVWGGCREVTTPDDTAPPPAGVPDGSATDGGSSGVGGP